MTGWCSEKCLQLVDEFEKWPELWQAKHQFYYDRNKKNDAWLKIALAMGCTVEAAKKKMDSLLSSFRREKLKGKVTVGTGVAAKDVYKSKWFAFSRMHFLLDKDEPRPTYDSEERNLQDLNTSYETSKLKNRAEEEDEFLADDPGEMSKSCNETENFENDTVRQSEEPKPNSSGSYRQHRSKRPRLDSTVGPSSPSDQSMTKEALEILKNAVSKNSTRFDDTCTSFGKHVENKLREYDKKTRDMVQFHMNTILYHADMGNMDIEVKTTRVSHINPFSDYSFPVEQHRPSPYHHLTQNSRTSPYQAASENSSLSYSPNPSPQEIRQDVHQMDTEKDGYLFVANSLTKL